MKRYLIAVDIGTQSTKAALVDENLNVRYTAVEESRLISPEPGTVWQNAEDIYGACIRTIQMIMEKSCVPAGSIQAIGVDGQMAGIMGIDKDGEAATSYDSWLDTRCSKYVPFMEKESGDEIMAASGGPVTCNHATKIIWLKNYHPDLYKKTKKFVLPHGYVTGKMTGNDASKATFDYTCLHFNSFSDNKRKCWNEEMLYRYGIDASKMPDIVSPFTVAGTITEEFAKISGLISGIPVVAGLGDSAASTFGTGMFEKNKILDCAGTASILCSVVDAYVPDCSNKTLVMMRSPIDGLWLPLSYIGGGGMCVRWVRDQLSGTPSVCYEKLEEEAHKIPAGSEGLLFCPHFAGRVLPPEPEMKGGLIGLDFKHTKAHIYRAVMESIAYEYAVYLRIMQRNFKDSYFHDLTIMGGGAKSALFNQIKADVLGLHAETLQTEETALIGSAAVAGMGIGLIKDYKALITAVQEKKESYEPNPCNYEIYKVRSKEYERMLHLIKVMEKGA